MLVPVKSLRCSLKYAAWGYPAAHSHAWLQAEVIAKLEQVNAAIEQRTFGQGRLLIWDALRDFRTQQFLFETECARIAKQFPNLAREEVERIVENIVRPPRRDKPPPHTTGGAVDVTILIEDTDGALGLFDDFSDYGAADYFDRCPPRSQEDVRACELRRILRSEMRDQNFAGIDSEWWHFEFGTRHWAETYVASPLFDQIVEAPQVDAVSLGPPMTPPRQPIICDGVAQAFPSHEKRGQALRGEIPGNYYARTRHPNERAAAKLMRSLLGEYDTVFLPSGLNAAVCAVWAFTPPGGRVIVDDTTYYETRNSIAGLAGQLGWTVVQGDLSSDGVIRALLGGGASTVFCDHPRNWLLTNPALRRLKQAAQISGAKLIVDTSVQPVQKLVEQGLADIQVFSLSKYPSAGATVAGAVFGPADLLEQVRRTSAQLGLVLAPEAAATLQRNLPTLVTRMAGISSAARTIAGLLRSIPFVTEVRIPDLNYVKAEEGGQVSFRLDPRVARKAEQIIAANTLDDNFPLAFGCTFGALYTTFEHFDSRNVEDCRPSIGSNYIEPGWVRLGLGYEPTDKLISALRFVLFAANAKDHPADRALCVQEDAKLRAVA